MHKFNPTTQNPWEIRTIHSTRYKQVGLGRQKETAHSVEQDGGKSKPEIRKGRGKEKGL